MSAIGLLFRTASRVIFEPSHRRLAICDLSSDPRLRSLPSARLSPCRSAVDSAALARVIISNRAQALVALERTTQLRTQVCPLLSYDSNPSLYAISYPGRPWRSAGTHHLLESICSSQEQDLALHRILAASAVRIRLEVVYLAEDLLASEALEVCRRCSFALELSGASISHRFLRPSCR